MTVTIWQMLALLGAGGLLALAALAWLAGGVANRQHDDAGSCFGQLIALIAAVVAIGLLALAWATPS